MEGLLYFFEVFQALHKLKETGFRVDAPIYGGADFWFACCIIGESVEFSPLGWYNYTKPYMVDAKERFRRVCEQSDSSDEESAF
jgi:hypothetical protein